MLLPPVEGVGLCCSHLGSHLGSRLPCDAALKLLHARTWLVAAKASTPPLNSTHANSTPTQVRMPSPDYARIAKDLSSIGEGVTIAASKEGVKFTTAGDVGTANITLRCAAERAGLGCWALHAACCMHGRLCSPPASPTSLCTPPPPVLRAIIMCPPLPSQP